VWWWLLLVGMAATCSFLWRLQQVVRPADEFYDLLPPDSPHDTKEAVLRYHFRHHLGRDGLLLFTFVRSHAGAIVARNLLARIAKEYRRRVEQHALRQVRANSPVPLYLLTVPGHFGPLDEALCHCSDSRRDLLDKQAALIAHLPSLPLHPLIALILNLAAVIAGLNAHSLFNCQKYR
jgi:hypothetical protein